jgi:hypothetical protein
VLAAHWSASAGSNSLLSSIPRITGQIQDGFKFGGASIVLAWLILMMFDHTQAAPRDWLRILDHCSSPKLFSNAGSSATQQQIASSSVFAAILL